MQKKHFSDYIGLIAAMCIFGSIGVFRKYIDLPSSIIALARALIGTVSLLIPLAMKRKEIDLSAIAKNCILLLLSGAALGFNWIFLFESYCHTTVATATLCYYMAPILIILLSPVLFREKMTIKKAVCIIIALVGILLISGVLDAGISGIGELKGIGFGLAAAVLYAAVVLLNKKISGISSLLRTVIQLGVSGVILLPYTLLTEEWGSLALDRNGIIMLAVVGIVHTGIAYALYFGSIKKLPAQTVAIFSYVDPVLAIILSALFLQEPMSLTGIAGSVLILGAAFLSEIKQ